MDYKETPAKVKSLLLAFAWTIQKSINPWSAKPNTSLLLIQPGYLHITDLAIVHHSKVQPLLASVQLSYISLLAKINTLVLLGKTFKIKLKSKQVDL